MIEKNSTHTKRAAVMNVRAIAAQTLAPVFKQGCSLTVQLDENLSRVEEKDRPLLRTLCIGAIREYHRLDEIINLLVQKPFRGKDKDIYSLVIIGLFQITSMRTPDHAAISETVEAARQLNKAWACKLVNGILRNYLRQKDVITRDLEDNVRFRFAHPDWLVRRLEAAWPEKFTSILEVNNEQAPLSIRVNKRRSDCGQVSNLLDEHEISHSPLKYSSSGMTLKGAQDISKAPGFEDGFYSVQDEAAQLSAHLLSLAPQVRVLDACAAPGGKACHILEAEPDLEEVLCVEIEEKRIQRIKENFDRLGLSAKIIHANLLDLDKWWDGRPFDNILLDAPCSATGVIRRHPDIKILRRDSDIANLAELQLKMLNTVWPTLKQHGHLLYATCSLLPDENEEIIAKFIGQHSDAIHDPIAANWGEARPYGRQLFPQSAGHDGFYYARIIKSTAS